MGGPNTALGKPEKDTSSLGHHSVKRQQTL